MTTVVLNATGLQARAIADRLERDGAVRRLARSTTPGIVAVDTTSRAALAEAFAGAEAVVFTSPTDYRSGARQAYAERVTAAAADAGIRRLVLNTAASVVQDGAPETAALREIRDIVRAGRAPTTVVQPTVYLDNLLGPWTRPGIVGDGLLAYALPEAVEVSWISHAALAEFIAAALKTDAAEGAVFDIGGSRSLTGPELAGIVGQAAGRPIRYVAIEPEAFAEGLAQVFGPEAAREIGGGYRRVADGQVSYARDDTAWGAVGADPETPEAWAARQDWTAS